MNKLKGVVSLLLLFLFFHATPISIMMGHVNHSTIVLAADDTELDIQIQPATEDTKELYDRYKDNSFSLMNKEFSSINKINQFMQNFFLTIKNFLFGMVVFVGKFNVMLVNSLFTLDIANAIKEPIQEMSLVISGNIVGMASTIGVLAIAIFMITKLVSTGQSGQAMKVFFVGLLSFVVLTTFNHPTSNKYFFDGILEVDNQIENALAGLNPQFTESEIEDVSVGEKIASDVFRTNIFEPYLYFNYGTTDMQEIRKKTVEYKDKKYDRIGALLDNDSESEKQIVFIEKITDYEVDELNNSNPSYKSAMGQSFLALMYLVTNLIQTVVFGILGLLRLALQFLLIVIPLFLPIIMIVGMVLIGNSLLGNFFKGFMSISFMKASLSFITVVFINYVSLAYTMGGDSDNVMEIIITRIAWIVAPIFIYKFRYLIGGIFSQTVRMSGGGLIHSFRHPNLARDMARQNRKDKKDQKKQAREERQQKQKQKKNNVGNKDKLNEVQPKNAKFSSERQKNKKDNKDNVTPYNNPTKSIGKSDLNESPSNKDKVNKDSQKKSSAETGNKKDGQQPKRTTARNERASNHHQEKAGQERNNLPEKNRKKENGEPKKSNSNIRKERVKQDLDNDKNAKEKASKGAVNPVKKKQTNSDNRRVSTDRTNPKQPKVTKGIANRSLKQEGSKSSINRQSLPKKMVQPTSKAHEYKQMKKNKATLKIKKRETKNHTKLNKKAPKFSIPKNL